MARGIDSSGIVPLNEDASNGDYRWPSNHSAVWWHQSKHRAGVGLTPIEDCIDVRCLNAIAERSAADPHGVRAAAETSRSEVIDEVYAEIDAIRACVISLEPLDYHTRRRIMRYLDGRYPYDKAMEQ